MTEIIAHQQFYSSVPQELTGYRGGQTFARSANLPVGDRVEASCYFLLKDDEGTPDQTQRGWPVNWGWFPIDEKYACVHRVGDAGSDDKGRRGNFHCHNLVFRLEDLRQIQFDIPRLIDWIRTSSPIRYHRPAGDDGFARRYFQVCERLGYKYVRDEPFSEAARAKLRDVEPLKFNAADILRLQAEGDQECRKVLAQPEAFGFKFEALRAMLCVLLAKPKNARPILLSGLGEGEDESSAEMRLMRVLFSLLPLHVRKHMTFATFCHAEYLNFRTQGNHAVRALCVINKFSNPGLLKEIEDQVYQIDVATGTCRPAPEESESFKSLVWRIQDANWDRVFKLRDFANHFDFQEADNGMITANALFTLTTGTPANEYTRQELKEAIADQFRYCPSLWTVAGQFHSSIEQKKRSKDEWTDSASVLLELIDKQDEHWQESDEIDRDWLADKLMDVFQKTFEYAAWETSAATVGVLVKSKMLANQREALFGSFASAFDTHWQQRSVTDAVEFWQALQPACPEDVASAGEFLKRVCQRLCSAFLDAQRRGAIHHALPDSALSLLSSVPIDSEQHLRDLLELLGNASESMDVAQSVLQDLCSNGNLQPQFVKSVCEQSPETVVRFYRGWSHVCRKVAVLEPVLTPFLKDFSLLACLWTSPAEKQDGPFLQGMRQTTAGLLKRTRREADVDMAPLYAEYESQGWKKSVQNLRNANPNSQGACDLVAAHAIVIKFLLRASPELANPLRTAMGNHLLNLVVFVCRTAWPHNSPLGFEASRILVALLDRLTPTAAERINLISQAQTHWPKTDELFAWGNMETELAARFGKEECRFYRILCQRVQRAPIVNLAPELPELVVDLLVDRPESVAYLNPNTPETTEQDSSEFLEYLRSNTGTGVWDRLSSRFASEVTASIETEERRLKAWFNEDSPRLKYLVPELEKRGVHVNGSEVKYLQQVGEALAKHFTTSPSPKRLKRVQKLLSQEHLPKLIRGPLESAMAKKVLHRYVSHWKTVQENWIDATDEDKEPDRVDECGKLACQIAPLVQRLAHQIPASETTLEDYLGFLGFYLGYCEGQFPEDRFWDLLECVPTIVKCSFPSLGKRDGPVAGWDQFFRSLKQTLPREFQPDYLVDCLVTLGEIVTESPQPDNHLTTFYNERRMNLFVERHERPDDHLAVMTRLTFLSKAELPLDDLEALADIIFPRARFALSLFGRSTEKLGRVCRHLGYQPGRDNFQHWDLPICTAMALAACLTLEGRNPTIVKEQAAIMFSPPFLEGLGGRYSEVNARRDELRQCLAESLIVCGTDEKTASSVSKWVSRRLGGLFGSIANALRLP